MVARIITVAYLLLNIIAFAVGVHVLQIREMGLYLFLMRVGAPASLAVVPLSETLAQSVGWSLGSLNHVWVADLACALTNVGVIWGLFWTVERVTRGRKRGAV